MSRPRVPLLAWVLVALVAVILAVGGLTVVRRTLEVPGSGSELKALNADPLLATRAPGTALTSQKATRAHRTYTINERFIVPTRVEQTFSLDGNVSDVADTYRAATDRTGWHLVAATCGWLPPQVRMEWRKDFPGFVGNLELVVTADAAKPGGIGPGSVHLVATTGEPLATMPNDRLAGVDMACLRRYRPDDPRLRPPTTPFQTSDALCARLSRERIRSVLPSLSRIEGDGTGAAARCGSRDPFLLVVNADEPRAAYEGRPLALRVDERAFFTTVPGEGKAVWIQTPDGPVLVVAMQFYGRDLVADDSLLAVARVIAS